MMETIWFLIVENSLIGEAPLYLSVICYGLAFACLLLMLATIIEISWTWIYRKLTDD